MDPLRETLKVTRIQYQAELLSKRDEMTGNKRKFGGNMFRAVNPHRLSDFSLSPRSNRFEASYCVTVGAREKKQKWKMRGGEGTQFFLSFQLSWRTRAETLATNANFSRSPGLKRVKRNKEEVNKLVFWDIEYEISSELQDENLNIKRIIAVMDATFSVEKGTAWKIRALEKCWSTCTHIVY